MVVEQFEILVDDDQQDRYRLECTAGQPHLLVLVGVPGPCSLEKSIAAGDFAVDRFAHPFRKVTLIAAEIG